MFKRLLKTALKGIPAVAMAAIEPTALINNAVGVVVKHKTKIDNQQIPVLNLIISIAAFFALHYSKTSDWKASIVPAFRDGAAAMGMSTAIHQVSKISLKDWAKK